MTQDEKDRILSEPRLPRSAPSLPTPSATREEQEALRREAAESGMTIEKMLEWSWLFDDDVFWDAISESRGGRGIHTRRIP